MKHNIGKKYKIKCSRGEGVITILNILEDACGIVYDCQILEGKFKSFKGSRKEKDYLCIRPEECELELTSSFS